MKFYLAFKFNEEFTARLAKLVEECCSDSPPLVPTPLDRLHVTTLFLGDVDESTARRVLAASSACRQFVVNVNAPDTFPRVLYLQVADVHGHLHALHDVQNDTFRALGGNPLPKAQYIPHLTLAKCDGKPQGSSLEAKLSNMSDAVSTFQGGMHLIRSVGLYTKSDCLGEVELLP
jgi:2'-5' RNA ligase